MSLPSTSGSSALEGHKDRVWHVCWSNSGDTLASCGGDKTVRLWKKHDDLSGAAPGTYRCVDTLEGAHTKTIRRCEFSTCDTTIASVSFDATTCIWDKGSGASGDDLGQSSQVRSTPWQDSFQQR